MALPAGQYLGAIGGSVAASKPRNPVSGHRQSVATHAQVGLGRTPWVDKAMKQVWERLAPHVDEAWMPQMDDSARKAFSVAEYGCGYYGCVLPTHTEGIVLKVTSDASEAMFAQGAINLKEWPAGMIRYHKVLAMAGQKYKRRPLFLLWRDEAHDIGYIQHAGQLHKAFRDNLGLFKQIAQINYRLVTKSRNATKLLQDADKIYGDWAAERVTDIVRDVGDYVRVDPTLLQRNFPPAQRLALVHRVCIYMGELMQGTPGQVEIGEALSFYGHQNILLADVHAGNVGRHEEPNGDFAPVITDPGQAVPMNVSWLQTAIQVV